MWEKKINKQAREEFFSCIFLSHEGSDKCLAISGNAFHLDSHQSSRVLPAGRRDHSADVVGCAAAWKVPDIRHDTRLDKVSGSGASTSSARNKEYQRKLHLRDTLAKLAAHRASYAIKAYL